jgi:hypothetical protein
MKCLDCPLKHIGQTEQTFYIIYREHIHDIRSNNSYSGYSNHILNTGHTYATIAGIMDVKTTGRKGKHLNIFERYHIYRISKDYLQMNDIYRHTQNPIFETLHELYTRQQHPHPQLCYESGISHAEYS